MRKYRLTGTVKLYHLSTDRYPDGTVFRPRVPDNIAEFEDDRTKRICVSTSVTGCFKAMGYEGVYAVAWIYEPVEYGRHKIADHIFQPTRFEVPDVMETREKWITCPVRMKLVGYAELIPRWNSYGSRVKIHLDKQ